MNRNEALERAKALQTSNTKVLDNLISAENGGITTIELNSVVSFAQSYEANKQYFLTQNNGFDNVVFFATLGDKYDIENQTELFVSIFVRRFGIKDLNSNRYFPQIDGKTYKGSIKSFFNEFKNKSLKCTKIEPIETEYGTRNVYHWQTV